MLFHKPTVLANTNRDIRVLREEIFGPVVCVQSLDDDSLDSVAAGCAVTSGLHWA